MALNQAQAQLLLNTIIFGNSTVGGLFGAKSPAIDVGTTIISQGINTVLLLGSIAENFGTPVRMVQRFSTESVKLVDPRSCRIVVA